MDGDVVDLVDLLCCTAASEVVGRTGWPKGMLRLLLPCRDGGRVWIIADRAGHEAIAPEHVAEAIQERMS